MKHCWHTEEDLELCTGPHLIRIQYCCFCGKRRTVRFLVQGVEFHGKYLRTNPWKFFPSEVIQSPDSLSFENEECPKRVFGV